MDPEDLHSENGSATRSLLYDYDETNANTTTGVISSSPFLEPIISSSSSSFGSSAAFIGDADATAINRKTKPKTISTMTYILVTMVLLMICLFLASVFMPQTTGHDDDNILLPSSSPTSSSSGQQEQQQKYQQENGNNHSSDKMVRQNEPTGIHISLTGNVTEMYVQFATGDSGEPIVEFTKQNTHVIRTTTITSSSSTSWIKVKGTSTTYAATDMCQEPATLVSGFDSPGHLHTVKLYNLEPNTEYMYRVGLGFGQGVKWSEETYRFRTSNPPGGGGDESTVPAVTFLAFGDQGYSDSESHGSQQVAQLITSIINEQTIDSIHHIGDLCYANGVSHIWNAWLNMIQPYASQVPYMVANGNHEYDHIAGGSGGKDPSGEVTEFGFQPDWGETSFHSTGGECGVPISKRFATPDNGNSVFWYSYSQALVHIVVLSSEHNMTVGSRQYAWLEKDLIAVNRFITPWVVVEMHRPMYSDSSSNRLVGLGMQDSIEDLLYMHQVDVFISGHVHAYVRSCDGLYAHKCANGGPVYFTVGTGGHKLDTGPLLPPRLTEHSDNTRFGVGRATVYNATAMHWEFVAVGGEIVDEAWIRRDR